MGLLYRVVEVSQRCEWMQSGRGVMQRGREAVQSGREWVQRGQE